MSLVVWLPLTKDLRQQGLNSTTIEEVTSAVFDNNGKLGKCLSGGKIKIPANQVASIFNNTSMSIAFWYNNNTSETTGNHAICGFSGNGEGDTDAVRIWDFFNYSNPNTFHWSMGTLGGGSLSNIFPANTWVHVCVTWNAPTLKIYMDGVLKYTGSGSSNYTFDKSYYISFGRTPQKLNDFRIYDHCLSLMEVKELAKGLVLHYPLSDNSIQQMNNCWSLPTFETSASNGGSSHWAASGASGTQGQSTDKNYIFRTGQTYSHWVSNASTATGNYLFYQSPAFEGGSRSFQCICKEENGIPITDNVCYSCWNAGTTGGAANNHWTSIVPLGNGFYWCKCEDLRQDGSNDLVGIYIRPGYKVYFSEVWLENDRMVCSNPFFQSNIVYDCSGFCNNGIITGTFTCSSDTPKYQVSQVFNGTDNAIQTPNLTTMVTDKNYTIACWTYKTVIGTKNYQTIYGGPSGFELEARSSSSTSPLYRIHNWGGGTTAYNFGEWTHFCFVHTDSDSKLYVNGELKITGTSVNVPSGNYFVGAWNTSTSQNYEGNMSDFRIYATALSADDVKSLYQNNAYIDSSGNVYGVVYNEV